MYDDLAYDEDPHFHCLESTQHSWILDVRHIKAQLVMMCKSHVSTFMIPPISLVKLSSCIIGTNPPLCFVNIMARTNPPFPCPPCIEWLKWALTSHPKPTLNQPKIEWSSLPTLHEGSKGCYEVTPLMTPETVTPWAWALLHCG